MQRRREPLAYRMAPRTLDEYVGQSHILAQGKLLRRMIEADRLSSILLFGPPGTGKTSLARVIAACTEAEFYKLNAVTSGVSDLKKLIELQKSPLFRGRRALLFIDEIHRFNKAQQDALLPHVEDGSFILIGATTENPYFEVNKALISRSTLFQLFPLSEEEIERVLLAALRDRERGLGAAEIELEEEALHLLANLSNGDARIALNALELAALTTDLSSDGKIRLRADTVRESVQKRSIAYDSDGEEHYDNISAFIKSMRGSDPDASIFYLARALHGGEDPEFLARRIVICAAEDVGMANPQALSVAMAAYQGAAAVGMPEARILLAEAAVMVATSPKSNASYMALNRAAELIHTKRCGQVPLHLRNAVLPEMREQLSYGKGYKYAHDYPGNIVEQDYLPEEIRTEHFYEPSQNGYEQKIKIWLDERRSAVEKKRASRAEKDIGTP